MTDVYEQLMDTLADAILESQLPKSSEFCKHWEEKYDEYMAIQKEFGGPPLIVWSALGESILHVVSGLGKDRADLHDLCKTVLEMLEAPFKALYYEGVLAERNKETRDE